MTSVLLHVIACFLLGAVFLYRGSRALDPVSRRLRWIKFAVFFAIILSLIGVGALADVWSRAPLRAVLWAIIFGSLLEMVRLLRQHRFIRSAPRLLFTGALLVASTCMLLMGETISGHDFVYLFGTVALFDGFSQTCGQLFGHRRLAARTSPGKTIEGALAGACFAMIPLLLYGAPMGGSLLMGAFCSIALCAAALAGDLTASWIKRQANVKDFSRLLPGHGGLLDRFDSLFGASCAWMLLPGNGLV